MPYPASIQALVRQSRENFPVASWLLPAHARAPILHFYRFAREADNIADSPQLSPEEKLTALDSCRDSLERGDIGASPAWMHDYLRDIAAKMVSARHGLDLLSAFRQDATQLRYRNFAELRDYCQRSAASVGRLVLEACGETRADLDAADALCTVLQLLNHLQDCQEDYRLLNRVYLPLDWLREANVDESELGANRATPALQAVFERYLDQCYQLLARAETLPSTLRFWSTRFEIAFILELAYALIGRLSASDPLVRKIRVPAWQWALCLLLSPRRLW